MISESLYQFLLHYAENITMQVYGSVEHEGHRITYLDTIPVILRAHKYKMEVQHNDELKKKGSDFIVFSILWGFQRVEIHKGIANHPVVVGWPPSDPEQIAQVDKIVLEFMLPRMKDKKRFLEDFGFPFDKIDSSSERFESVIAQLK